VVKVAPACVAVAVAFVVNVFSGCRIFKAAAVRAFALHTGSPCTVFMAETCNEAAAVVANAVHTSGSVIVCTSVAFDLLTALKAGSALTREAFAEVVVAVAVNLFAANETVYACTVSRAFGTNAVGSNGNVPGVKLVYTVFIIEITFANFAVPVFNVTGSLTVNRFNAGNVCKSMIRVTYVLFTYYAVCVAGVGKCVFSGKNNSLEVSVKCTFCIKPSVTAKFTIPIFNVTVFCTCGSLRFNVDDNRIRAGKHNCLEVSVKCTFCIKPCCSAKFTVPIFNVT